tara:strand:+ start:2316 stop:3659 length:1344 start_codon:yes stop_codon:yes gene_type:complete
MKLTEKTPQTTQDAIIKKSIYVLFLRVFGSAIQMLTLLLITNYAQEKLVGQYNYFNATIVLLGSLTLLGMNNSFLQFSGRFEAEGQFEKVVSLYKKKLSILAIAFCVLLAAFLFASKILNLPYFRKPDVTLVLYKAFICLFPFSATLLNLEVIRALGLLFTSEVFRNIGRHGLFFAFVVGLIICDDIQQLLNVYIIAFIFLSIATTSIIVFKTNQISLKLEQLKVSYKDIIKVSFPMSFSLISLLIMQSFDIYVLEAYYSLGLVAYYGVAIKVSAVVGVILTSINATIAPKIAKLFFGNEMKELKIIIKKAKMLNVGLSIPLIVLIILTANYILSFFGQNYVLAREALYIILGGQIINALCGPVGLYLNMTGRQVFFQRLLLVTLAINVAMNLMLIPKHEMVGAAISTAFSFSLWNIAGLLYVLKKDKINLSIFGFLTKLNLELRKP